MRKRKIVNHLKKLSLFLMILGLYNCQKEDASFFEQTIVNLEKVKKVYASEFNKTSFPEIRNEPLWDKANVFFNGDDQYVEVPYRIVKQRELAKSSSMSIDYLVARVNSDNTIKLEIVHYFAQDIKKNKMLDFEKLSYNETKNFHGFITKYDLNKNVISVDRYINGVKSEESYSVKNGKNSALLSKVNEDCIDIIEETVTEYCMFWYNPITLDEVEIISCTYVQTFNTYTSCGGNSNSGNQTGGVTIISVDEYFELINNLTGNAKCVFEKLKELELYKQTINKFENSPNYHLTLSNGVGCNSSTDEACTDASDIQNGRLKINIQNEGRGTLDLAAVILHEGIHAEIYRYVDQYKKGLDPNNRANLLYWYKYYKAQNTNGLSTSAAQHQHMADNFVLPIANAIRTLDNDKYPIDYYMVF